ncbi:MAG: hypothetical protein EA427_14965 [Spirochaetaceae bacterium]|nr:MAG: hypothetical protein EA427_14965 [Spirochaetaceae bacterium]
MTIPFESLGEEGGSSLLVGEGGRNGAGDAFAGVTFAGGETGVVRVLADVVAGVKEYGYPEPVGDETGDARYRVQLPREVLTWIADPLLLWRTLAALHGPGQVEVTLVTGQELNGVFHTPGEVPWHCRAGDVGWIVVQSGGGDERALGRGLQGTRDILRGTGMPRVEVTMERSPPSVARTDARLLRLATAEWTAWWPIPTLNRLLARIVDTPGGDRTDTPPGGSLSMQRAAAARICDYLLRKEGIGGLSTFLPRTAEERRSRYAVRTVTELLRAGGIAPRTLVESAYRSGSHYRALVSLVAGLQHRDREVVGRALGRRRWEQVLDHSTQHVPVPAPWIDFSLACEMLIRDLADRSRRPGYSPPGAVNELVSRFYSGPRDARLREAWQKQIEAGALARTLEEARLSLLRPLLRRLPRIILVQAGCGDTREVQMRISSTFSRRGRRMYLEDVAVLEAAMKRGNPVAWDELLAARMTVRAAAARAGGGTVAGSGTVPRRRGSPQGS